MISPASRRICSAHSTVSARGNAPEGAAAQWYLLALDGETVRLYLLGDGCYRAQTALLAPA